MHRRYDDDYAVVSCRKRPGNHQGRLENAFSDAGNGYDRRAQVWHCPISNNHLMPLAVSSTNSRLRGIVGLHWISLNLPVLKEILTS